jgi:hypothetical protein
MFRIRKSSIILTGLIFLSSCHNHKTGESGLSDSTKSSAITTSIYRSSYMLDSLISILTKENYLVSIDTIRNKTFNLIHSEDRRSELLDTLKIQASQQIRINAKRKHSFGNSFFPKFTITELFFFNADFDSISAIASKIKTVIYNPNDMLNEKEYDRIEATDDRIFYITTNAKLFEDFVIDYDNKIKKLINVR